MFIGIVVGLCVALCLVPRAEPWTLAKPKSREGSAHKAKTQSQRHLIINTYLINHLMIRWQHFKSKQLAAVEMRGGTCGVNDTTRNILPLKNFYIVCLCCYFSACAVFADFT